MFSVDTACTFAFSLFVSWGVEGVDQRCGEGVVGLLVLTVIVRRSSPYDFSLSLSLSLSQHVSLSFRFMRLEVTSVRSLKLCIR